MERVRDPCIGAGVVILHRVGVVSHVQRWMVALTQDPPPQAAGSHSVKPDVDSRTGTARGMFPDPFQQLRHRVGRHG